MSIDESRRPVEAMFESLPYKGSRGSEVCTDVGMDVEEHSLLLIEGDILEKHPRSTSAVQLFFHDLEALSSSNQLVGLGDVKREEPTPKEVEEGGHPIPWAHWRPRRSIP